LEKSESIGTSIFWSRLSLKNYAPQHIHLDTKQENLCFHLTLRCKFDAWRLKKLGTLFRKVPGLCQIVLENRHATEILQIPADTPCHPIHDTVQGFRPARREVVAPFSCEHSKYPKRIRNP
jgi:hypothetical protein